jgi:small subunit ribosomal protein S16
MLAIKLARRGKRNQPFFRLIVQEKARDPFGTFLENLGNWDSRTKKGEFKKERIVHWISKGAQPTPSVNNLLINQGIITGSKKKASRQPKKKAEEAKSVEIKPAEAKPETKAPAAA